MRAGALAKVAVLLGLVQAPLAPLYAETFLTVEQARQALWADVSMVPINVELTKAQMKAITKASNVRVSRRRLNAWKTAEGGWFIIDQVVGKHEMIDMAVALDAAGKVVGLEVLTYRETYGDEIKHPKWLAQFLGRGNEEYLKLDQQIKNISGATLSCRHVTDGVNRWVHTWDQVLRHI
ncbi:Na(+)-translocating NADH-quinone reductase subunit C [Gammaproteobacteria bacterium 53_120_T64]|nr:Na(+)-translocating NADH-quinone reductase subunit C [Gammaproteobacteria bacterium 53_120_T64]